MFRRREEDPMNSTNDTTTGQQAGTDSTYTAGRPADAPKAPAVPVSGYRPASPSAARAQERAASSNLQAPDRGQKSAGKRVLTVGNDILLKGEIATCDRLVIEGKVDATLKDVHTVELAETGSFKGTAEVEDAEISGLFEGDLVVRNRLVIYSTGKVRGSITYGEIEIERGGEISGEIKTSTAAASTSTSSARRAA